MNKKPFITVNFYELEDQNSTYRDKTNAPISFTKRDNISLISYQHHVLLKMNLQIIFY